MSLQGRNPGRAWRGLHITALALLVGPALAPREARAQHAGMQRPGAPAASQPLVKMEMDTREGSGTSWLPDFSPMYGHHGDAGGWDLMLHENVFLQYVFDGSERGHDQLGSVNWVMAMARRPLAGGVVRLNGMLSIEPLTVGECGYPDLLATGELCDGAPIVDRQHPHDLLMELSALYNREVAPELAFQLYGAAAGEPALGPVAFPHRVSALTNPIAPISHHWLDATHISFGVATLGLFGRRWKVEGSLFNGREPDEERYDLDLAALDSYSGRVTLMPTERWALQLSAGHLEEAEAPHEEGEGRSDVERVTASAIYHHPVSEGGTLATTLAWGRNVEEDEATHATLLETSLQVGDTHAFFARGEVVEKLGHDFVIEELEDRKLTVGKFSLGYVRTFPTAGRLVPGVGVSGSVSFLPEELEPFYGERNPLGFAVFVQLRPRVMSMEEHQGMGGHEGMRETVPEAEEALLRHPDAEPGPGHAMHGGGLDLDGVLQALGAHGVHIGPPETVHQPFWSVPSTVYPLHARTPDAALHVNVYDTPEAAEADAARIGRDGAVGTTLPRWVATPHFYVARNVLLTLLVEAGPDAAVEAAVRATVEGLGGRAIDPEE